MILDLALGFAIFLAIITGIIGSIIGLTVIAFDLWTRHQNIPTKDTQ